MKKLFIIAALAVTGLSLGSCSYDDLDLWNAVEELDSRVDALEEASKKANDNIVALQQLVEAIQKNIFITKVETTANGYVITFSDGTTATINNGKDGIDAPAVSVKKDTDGQYYWTLDGEWLLDENGNKIKASATDGEDAIAPQVRINSETNEWEISVDGGTTWTSTGISAVADCIFESIDNSNEDYVIFTLKDGTTIQIPKYNESTPVFEVAGTAGGVNVVYEKSKTFEVTAKNVADYSISKPDGWRAAYNGTELTITAPAASNTYAEQEGEIAINAVSEKGISIIVKIKVKAIEYEELRVLTFEDADYKAGANYIGETSWSSLIDTPEYGGPLIYGDYSYTGYEWYDENNTYLQSAILGGGPFWNGGHVVSNYASTDVKATNTFNNQLTVYGEAGKGGNNESANFCVQNGYADAMSYSQDLPYFEFGDGQARVIDHMYVNSTNYLYDVYLNGNGFSKVATETDWFKIIATGYDADGNETGTEEFMLANGLTCIQQWTKWELKSLGKVIKVTFNLVGTDVGDWGLNTPAYFAYDDVAVQF